MAKPPMNWAAIATLFIAVSNLVIVWVYSARLQRSSERTEHLLRRLSTVTTLQAYSAAHEAAVELYRRMPRIRGLCKELEKANPGGAGWETLEGAFREAAWLYDSLVLQSARPALTFSEVGMRQMNDCGARLSALAHLITTGQNHFSAATEASTALDGAEQALEEALCTAREAIRAFHQELMAPRDEV